MSACLEFAKRILTTSQFAPANWLEQPSCVHRFVRGTVALTWWTFAGGRINQTLKYAIEWQGRWKVVPDNLGLRIEGDGVSFAEAERVAGILKGDGFWEAAETKRRMLSAVPEYRLSKFQRVLPASWQVEMVGGYLLDFEGAHRWLMGTSESDLRHP